jgi:Fic family protein
MGPGARGYYEEATWTPDFARAAGRPKGGRYKRYTPPSIAEAAPQLQHSTATLSERAGTAVRDLNQHAGSLASLESLGRQLMRSEALASSWIEGLQLSHRKLAQATVPELASHKAQDVLGNLRAMERAIELGANAPELAAAHIREIHHELAAESSPPMARIAGTFREQQGWVGGTSPVTADYVPPAAAKVPGLVDDLCEFMNRDDLSPVTQAAMAHAQFELIHPFADGNGRVGRCLIHTILRRRGTASDYVPPISLVLGADKDAYIAGMDHYEESQVGGWPDPRLDEWIAHFSRVVETAALHARTFSERVHALQGEWRRRIGSVRRDAAVLPLIDALPSYPFITARIGIEITGRSRPAVIDALDRLDQAGVLSRHRNQKKGDSWEAKQLFQVLEEFEHAVGAGLPA